MILALLDAAEAGDLRYYIVTYSLKKFRGEIQTKKLFRQIEWVVVYISKNIQIIPQFGIRIVYKKVGSLTNILYLYR